eukprot:CAMPEP_0176009058 /NCGR_PEP_ID=MMETSP0120_2-20121206/4058_1 /TAXON_ID=160619 /ORGANISM="Kryptoperidinium foliaceum, Strain CCMP 1326" /LENGTH=108 /DNA_ID=CAMNT_0017341849 /DNA_START=225 /DNA_END=551 /DNA_ORIENTATION=+
MAMPMDGVRIRAAEKMPCSMPMRVPFMFCGTMRVFSAVMLVARLYRKRDTNNATPTKPYVSHASGNRFVDPKVGERSAAWRSESAEGELAGQENAKIGLREAELVLEN